MIPSLPKAHCPTLLETLMPPREEGAHVQVNNTLTSGRRSPAVILLLSPSSMFPTAADKHQDQDQHRFNHQPYLPLQAPQ